MVPEEKDVFPRYLLIWVDKEVDIFTVGNMPDTNTLYNSIKLNE